MSLLETKAQVGGNPENPGFYLALRANDSNAPKIALTLAARKKLAGRRIAERRESLLETKAQVGQNPENPGFYLALFTAAI